MSWLNPNHSMRAAIALSLPTVLLLLSLSGCGEVAKLPESAGIGPQPALPPPNHTLFPTVHIAVVADDVRNAVWRVMPAATEKRVALLH